jgi:NAD(P)H dehydrogenase (quinone)
MIVITAATGHLGRLVLAGLLAAGVEPREIVAAVRRPENAADLAGRGVQVRRGDYDDPQSLGTALAGAEKVLLISGSDVGRRVQQHSAVVEAARRDGASHIVYTSVLRPQQSPVAEHKGSEAAILASGLPHTFLRNGWYTESYTAAVAMAADSGVIIGSAGDGRVSSATRADYAAAAVAVLTGEGHEGKAYDLSGDVAWTYADLAEAAASVLHRDVTYQNLAADAHRAALTGAGLPAPVADFVVSVDQAIAQGLLEDHSGDLARLIGRPTTPLAEGLARDLKNT